MVKAAASYTFVLRGDGTVATWGFNASGELDVPPGLSNVVAISAGYYMPMALTADGHVHVWGAWGHVSQAAIINPPPQATNVVAIAGGMAHCVALRDDGQVIAWGDNLFGQTDVPAGLSNIVDVAAGQAYSLAITGDGRIIPWGNIWYYGEIPADATNVFQISASEFGHALALRRDGTVVAWGNNSLGQAMVPPGLTNVVSVAAAGEHSLALKEDGTVVAWGGNFAGQGVVPASVVRARAIAAGDRHNVVISDAPLVEDISPEQSVMAGADVVMEAKVVSTAPWIGGWLRSGQWLVQTNTVLVLTNVQAEHVGPYTFVSSNEFGFSDSSVCYLSVGLSRPRWMAPPEHQAVPLGQRAVFFAGAVGTEPLYFQWHHDGQAIPGATNRVLEIDPVTLSDQGSYTVMVWNDYGSITSSPRYLVANLPRILSQPNDINGRTNWAVATEIEAISPTPMTYRWFKDGIELIGQEGPGLRFDSFKEEDAGEYLVEVSNANGSVSSRAVRVAVISGENAPSEPGVLVDWGNSLAPTQEFLNEVTNVVALAAGSWHTLALKVDGSLRLWADPFNLSLNTIPATATNVAALFAGPSYNLVLRKDGTVVGWGSPLLGNQPVIPSISNVVSASCSGEQALLLRKDGTIAVLPSSATPPANFTNLISVATTENYSCAVDANGKVLLWAWPDFPLARTVPGLPGAVAVAGGQSWVAAALLNDGRVAEFGIADPESWFFVEGISNAVAISGGGGFAALLSNGEVRTWDSWWGTVDVPEGLRATRIASRIVHFSALTLAPFFDSQPMTTRFFAGENGRLEANLRSATPMTLQWYYDETPIPGATNKFLEFQSAKPGQSGNYKLVAKNLRFESTSRTAVVTVEGVPEILTLSPNQRLLAGETLQLGVDYVSYPAAVAQWRFNGFSVPGATNSVLIVPRATESMSGVYTLVLSNAYGVVISSTIEVIVSPSPPIIVTQPTAPDAMPDSTPLTLRVEAVGSEPLSYQWFYGENPIPGQTDASLVFEAVTADQNGTYRVRVNNAIGTALSDEVQITSFRTPPNPEIVTGNLLVREGKPFQLVAFAGGTGGATYQWMFNGLELVGETNKVLTVAKATLDHRGPYSVAVSNQVGAQTSPTVEVRVITNRSAGLVKSWGLLNGTPNALFAESVSAGAGHALALLPDGTVQAWGDNAYSQIKVPAGLSNVVEIAAGQHFSLALKSDGTVQGWGRNEYGQASPPVNLKDVVAVSGGLNHAVALKADGTIVAWGNSPVAKVPTNLPPASLVAGAPYYTLLISTNGMFRTWGDPQYPQVTNVPPGISNVVACSGSAKRAYVVDGAGQVKYWPSGIVIPSEATNLIGIAAGSDHAVALVVDGRLVSWGTDQYGQVAGAKGVSNILSIAAGGQMTLAISGEPKMLSVPSNRLVKDGSPVVLSVKAAGTPPLLSQWFLNGQPIQGGTNQDLVFNAFSASDAGSYSCRISNPYASLSTQPIAVTLGIPPAITNEPQDQLAYYGSNATFKVGITGSSPLAYQWMLNGTNLFAATNVSLTMSNLLPLDQGLISVRITNSFGTVLSREAELRVVPKPPPPSSIHIGVLKNYALLHLGVEPNETYVLQTSTNLLDWADLETFRAAGSTFELVRPVGTEPSRFYRLIHVNP